jgi:phosphoglycerate dehydrogenase-like enzyme
MDVIAHARSRERADAEGVPFVSDLAEFLGRSQVLSLHAPLTADTRGFLSANRIALLPPDAVVINTGRGELVVDDDLISALQSGRLAAAGLDVFTGEPNPDPRYLELPNAFLLPHIGSATAETRDAMGMRVIENLRAFARAQPLPFRVEEV